MTDPCRPLKDEIQRVKEEVTERLKNGSRVTAKRKLKKTLGETPVLDVVDQERFPGQDSRPT